MLAAIVSGACLLRPPPNRRSGCRGVPVVDRFKPGIAAEHLRRLTEGTQECATHTIAVAELSFGHSLRKDLADKGVRIQTVLPGATATEFWDIAGYPPQKTAGITMSAEDFVGAAKVRKRKARATLCRGITRRRRGVKPPKLPRLSRRSSWLSFEI